jgi:hypothetical protein
MSRFDAFDPNRPFTRAEGMAAGLTPWQLRGPEYAHPFHDTYLARTAPRTLATRARAAALGAPDTAVISHETAAVLWGGAVPECSWIHVTVPPGESFVRAGVRTHRLSGHRLVAQRDGLRMTTPEQTFIDLAGRLDLVQLVALGDRLVKRKVASPESLCAASDAWSGRYGSAGRRAATYVRSGVDSPPESRLRMLVVLAGLPEPTVNHIVRDPDTGEWLRRFELAYRDLLIAIEYEGRQHRDDDEIWAADIERREELDRETWRVVQVINKGLFETPLRTLQRIDQARVDRGARPTVAFNDEWKRYFPGR